MKTKYTIIIFLLLLFFVNVVVADLPTKTVYNPYGGHLQLIPNTTGIFPNTSALILALQGNDSVINNSIISLQGNDSVINNSIIALQNNDTVINASILQLQNNDTMDRSYVNNTFLPLAGGNMTGNINMGWNNITNTSYFINENNGSSFIRNQSYQGAAKEIAQFYTSSSVIRFRVTMNDATANNGGTNFRVNAQGDQSQDDPTGAGWAMVMKPKDPSFGSIFQIWRSIPGSITNEALFQIDSNQTVKIGVQSFTTVQINNLSGSGNAYVCRDSTGKLYSGNPTC